MVILLVFEYDGIVKEDLFFSASLPNITNSELYKSMKDYVVNKCDLEF